MKHRSLARHKPLKPAKPTTSTPKRQRRKKNFKPFVSKPEKEISAYLQEKGEEVISQYKILGNPFIYDLYLPKRNLLIEYQGDYWHANPHKYLPGTLIHIQGTGKVKVDSIWAKDAAKARKAQASGYAIAWIWEEDYKLLGMQVVDAVLHAHPEKELMKTRS